MTSLIYVKSIVFFKLWSREQHKYFCKTKPLMNELSGDWGLDRRWRVLLCSVYVVLHLSTEVFGVGRWGRRTLGMWQMMSAGRPCEQQLYLSRNRRKLKRAGGIGARGDTGRFVPLIDSPFSLISSRSSCRKKTSHILLLCLSNFTFLLHPPFFPSPSNIVFIKIFSLSDTGLYLPPENSVNTFQIPMWHLWPNTVSRPYIFIGFMEKPLLH